MKILHGMLGISPCLPTFSARAYQEPTHADMSTQAVRISNLNDAGEERDSRLGITTDYRRARSVFQTRET